MGTTIIGTYGYMAPEQFRGAAQPASDLYALGGTLLFLLSGAHDPGHLHGSVDVLLNSMYLGHERMKPPCSRSWILSAMRGMLMLNARTPAFCCSLQQKFICAGKPPGAFPQDGLRLDYGRDLVADPALDAVRTRTSRKMLPWVPI